MIIAYSMFYITEITTTVLVGMIRCSEAMALPLNIYFTIHSSVYCTRIFMLLDGNKQCFDWSYFDLSTAWLVRIQVRKQKTILACVMLTSMSSSNILWKFKSNTLPLRRWKEFKHLAQVPKRNRKYILCFSFFSCKPVTRLFIKDFYNSIFNVQYWNSRLQNLSYKSKKQK